MTLTLNFLKRNLLALALAGATLTACEKKTSDAVRPEAQTANADATATITVAVPANVEVGKPARFSGTVSGVYKYIASADGYILNEEVVEGRTSWAFDYSFNTAGNRHFHINAFDRNGRIIASANRDFVVAPRTNPSTALSQLIMRRCQNLGPKNRPYEFNGIGDCWGFVRQVWNAVLFDGGEHTEDYGSGYNKARWIRTGAPYLPIGDASSSNPNWRKVTDFNDLPVGVPLSSDRGHAWGAQWHGAIYAGKQNGRYMMWDCSGRSSRNGAYYRPISESPKISNGYYYVPLYNRLKGR